MADASPQATPGQAVSTTLPADNTSAHASVRWELPDGVDELLPEAAWRVEEVRRLVVDRCRAWHFDLVIPPLIEYTDSLLHGAGESLDVQTFKLVDQANGRTLGIRADMTQQVARIDAHALHTDGINRLFYIGTVLRARTDGFGGSRSPQQFGAELFGGDGVSSDLEIIRLMVDVACHSRPGVPLLLDLGHVGVYQQLVREANLSLDNEQRLFEAMQRGSQPDVSALVQTLNLSASEAERLVELLTLAGDAADVLADARQLLGGANPKLTHALDELQELAAGVAAACQDVTLHVDLGDLRGYRYHTGPLFALYDLDGNELARGGRYDARRSMNGPKAAHTRHATGFSGDLIRLADLSSLG